MVRLCVSIARELHRPVFEILSWPTRELNLWAAVYEEESRREASDEAEPTGRDAFRLLGGKLKDRK